MKNPEKIVSFASERERGVPKNGIVQTAQKKIAAWALDLPAIERQGIVAAMDYIEGMPEDEKTTALLALERVISPRIRGMKKAKYDVRKRTLIGARVNREFAELCKQAAKTSGRSMTKWCYTAFMDALIRQGRNVEKQFPDNDNYIRYGC